MTLLEFLRTKRQFSCLLPFAYPRSSFRKAQSIDVPDESLALFFVDLLDDDPEHHLATVNLFYRGHQFNVTVAYADLSVLGLHMVFLDGVGTPLS